MSARRDAPCRVVEVDLSTRPERAVEGGADAWVLFRWRGLPLGIRGFAAAELPLTRARLEALTAAHAAEVLAARAPGFGGPALPDGDGWAQTHAPLAAALHAADPLALLDRLAEPARGVDASDLTVIVCTRGRPQDLDRCLAALGAQNSPPGEVVVVDNAPDDPAARAVVERHPFARWTPEPAPGLSRARNTGVRAATRGLIAFTDDDVAAPPEWTAELVRAFDGGADAVTGLVAPLRLDTPARRTFQLDFGGFGETCVPMLFDRRFLEAGDGRGVPTWRMGAGANMAFRRSVFETVGLFDERLGAGASGCSEDSELWRRVLAAGGTCLYEPRALVRHDHRETLPALKSQLRAYMRGHVAALAVQYVRHRRRGDLKRGLLSLPKYFLRVAGQRLKYGRAPRFDMLGAEAAGWREGLVWYLRARREVPPPALEPRRG